METRRKWIGLGLAAAVLMATVGSVAAASASDGQLTRPPPTVMLANNNADVSLSEGATTVISMQLTQGRYLLTSNGLLYTEYTNAVGPLSFECQILVGTSQVAAMTSNGVSVQWTVALTGVARSGPRVPPPSFNAGIGKATTVRHPPTWKPTLRSWPKR